MEMIASLAGIREQLEHGVDRYVGDSADRPHRRAFAEHREDLDALGEGQLFHARTMRTITLGVKHNRSLDDAQVSGVLGVVMQPVKAAQFVRVYDQSL